MKLQELSINRYGPLQENIDLTEDVTIVHGPNESGKTLIVEALLKILSGGATGSRIEEKVDGYLIVEDEDGESRLDEDNSFLDYLSERSYEISCSQLENIFVVKDSDLEITEEEKFYERVTDSITGIHVDDIRTIEDKLVEKGRMTSKKTKNLSGSQQYENAEDHHDDAKDLLEDINSYRRSIDEDEIKQLEWEKLEKESKKNKLEERRRKVEELERSKQHKKLKEALHGGLKSSKELENLPDEQELSDLKKQLEELEDGKRDQLDKRRNSLVSLSKWSIAGAALTGAATIGLSFTLGLVAPLALTAGSIYFYWQSRQAGSKIVEIEEERKSILKEASKLDIEHENLEELEKGIAEMEEEVDDHDTSLKEKAGYLGNQLGIDKNSPKDVLEKAEEKLDERDVPEPEIELDIKPEKERERIDKEIGNIELEETKDTLKDHREKLREFSDRAGEINFKHFIGEPLDLRIDGLKSLERLEERLKDLIETIEHDKEVAEKALKIFEEVEQEEESKVNELFGDESLATELFMQVTSERYNGITYDNEDNKLYVHKGKGESFEPEELSQGARDQLYMCVRLALGQQLLEGDYGFFIMDDAFLSSDPQRLENQKELIQEITEEGWDVIYLTSKEDAVESLAELENSSVQDIDRLH